MHRNITAVSVFMQESLNRLIRTSIGKAQRRKVRRIIKSAKTLYVSSSLDRPYLEFAVDSNDCSSNYSNLAHIRTEIYQLSSLVESSYILIDTELYSSVSSRLDGQK